MLGLVLLQATCVALVSIVGVAAGWTPVNVVALGVTSFFLGWETMHYLNNRD